MESDASETTCRLTEHSSRRWCTYLIPIHVGLFLSAILLNLWALRPHTCSPLTNIVTQDSHHGRYALERFINTSSVKFDAELFSTSVYKGEPREELDRAWAKLVDHPMILVDRNTRHAFDASTEPTKGVGNHYYATVEIFHQLHCLDITRKFIWRDNYQHVNTFQNPPDIVWKHVDHCIDLLRQALMCNSATDLIFYTDLGSYKQPKARFSTNHVCKNFSQISDWVWRHNSEVGIFAGEDE